MIDMLSKYDNMHKNKIFYALICINNGIIARQNYMLSVATNPMVICGTMQALGILIKLNQMRNNRFFFIRAHSMPINAPKWNHIIS